MFHFGHAAAHDAHGAHHAIHSAVVQKPNVHSQEFLSYKKYMFYI